MVKRKIEDNSSRILSGGDGYAVNVLQPIAGRPSYIRYTDNCRPVFNGSLLQGGGSKRYAYKSSIDLDKYKDFSIIDTRPPSAGGPKCECEADKNPLLAWLNKESENVKLKKKNIQMGGFISTTGLEPFAAIQTLSKTLMPLGAGALASLILLLFLHNTVKNKLKKKKAIMMGGAVGALESVLMPLGKNNMIVLAAILLLHHYAKRKIEKTKHKRMSGGGSIVGVLTKLMTPLGINTSGNSVLLTTLRQAFIKRVLNKKDIMKGGFDSELKKNVSKISAKQFLAKGLFKRMEELFTLKMSDSEKTNEKFEELFNDIAPVAFSTFATKPTYKKAYELKKFVVGKNKKE